MKISEYVEDLCVVPECVFVCFPEDVFEAIDVEPIPTIGNIPKKLMKNGKNDTRGDEFIDAIRRQVKEHKK